MLKNSLFDLIISNYIMMNFVISYAANSAALIIEFLNMFGINALQNPIRLKIISLK